MKDIKLLLFIILISLSGCVSGPLTPEEQYERENTLIIERENFWLDHDTCVRKGGVVMVTLGGHIRKPIIKRQRPTYTIWEMRSMRCGRR